MHLSRCTRHLTIAIGLAAALAPSVVRAQQDPLASGFQTPPTSAKPHTWWHWINGNTTKAGIKADLEAMKRVGVAGAQIFNVDTGLPSGDAPFMGDRWQEMIKYAAEEANRLGIELCIHNCAGWSSSGGPWIKPEYAMQILTFSRTPVKGGATFSGMLAQPATRAGYYKDVAVLAYRSTGVTDGKPAIADIRRKALYERADAIRPDLTATTDAPAIPRDGIVDLTGKMDAAGKLTWDAPEGDWTVLRIGHTPTGAVNAPAPAAGRGLECDKLSREAMDQHWSGMMATVIRDLGPLAGKTLNNVLIDSYEVGSQNWTPKFREEFTRRRGYDPLPFLPVVAGEVVESVPVSERFLWDFRRTISDLFDENYYGYFAELCHKNGLRASTEPYGNGPFDNMQAGGGVDIPMGEFWVGGGTLETCKLAGSIGHTYGRQVIGAESFTADDRRGRWLIDPYSIKALGDLVFTLGVNRYIFHRYAHQPWIGLEPGMTMGPWGTHFERTETWWNPGAEWLRYVARCQYLLQSGRFVADAAMLEPEDAPIDMPGRGALPAGYDFDGVDRKVLQTATVKDGLIALPSGMTYRVLVLPDSAFMTVETARKIRALVNDGATVVGPKPTSTPGLSGLPQADQELTRIAGEVWGDVDGKAVTTHGLGKGRAIWGMKLGDVLTAMSVKPDFESSVPSLNARLAYIHRVAGDADLYFVSNQRPFTQEATCAFRVAGKQPELWHADTGVIEPAPVWREIGGRTEVPIRFDPSGSVFVVFRKPAGGADHLISASFTPAETVDDMSRAPRVTITKAVYGPADPNRGGADVTAKVAELVASGQYYIQASNELFGDPTPLVVKELRVEFTVDGKPQSKTVGENETMEIVQFAGGPTAPAYELRTGANGTVALAPWRKGTLEVVSATGKQARTEVGANADSLDVTGPWLLRFPPKLGAPAQVTMSQLISWPNHPDAGVKYFSGTAEYVKQIDVPAAMVARDRIVYLDLGGVKNLAEVTVNGRNLGVLWKPPFRVDVSRALKPGRNTVSVKVTNLWPNRLIGDEQLPPDVEWAGDHIARWPDWLVQGKPRPQTGRVAFATWRFFTKDSPLLESGLLGPVTVRSIKIVEVK